MYRDIVVGWDATEGARDALALAQLLLTSEGTIAAACVHAAAGAPRSADVLTPQETSDALGEARSEAEPGSTWLEPVAVEDRAAPDGLRTVVRRRAAGLLVIGSSRYGPVGRVHTGGVGRDLLGAAPCALALPPRRFYARASTLACVAVAFDGAHQLDSVAEAARLAASSGARLHVFCIMPELARWAQDASDHVGYSWENVSRQHQEHYRDLLDQAIAGLDTKPAAARVIEQAAAPDILAEASRDFDLLLTGPPASGNLQRFLAGVTSGTLHSAHCPVLICARAGDRAAPGSAETGAARA